MRITDGLLSVMIIMRAEVSAASIPVNCIVLAQTCLFRCMVSYVVRVGIANANLICSGFYPNFMIRLQAFHTFISHFMSITVVACLSEVFRSSNAKAKSSSELHDILDALYEHLRIFINIFTAAFMLFTLCPLFTRLILVFVT
ncbi:uncharacterized protein DEA37_0013455 [Paragonimus westermani]|uniref:Uncharacterized protein n=1 Tax=Paragonimus westermani TaxID=34504 RepID=A0A5J4NWY5_9TREM|nr:uncharacterized protein DEA37_0013455 [Paragonimus westermani]